MSSQLRSGLRDVTHYAEYNLYLQMDQKLRRASTHKLAFAVLASPRRENFRGPSLIILSSRLAQSKTIKSWITI